MAEITDKSFRTRLLRITYVDTDRKNRRRDNYAFVIEEKEHVGERLGWTMENVRRIHHSQLERTQANLIAVFEYVIGNTDFSMVLGAIDDPCCHNVTLYSETPGTFIPVPYDFDLAGIVNTPYATPNPKYKKISAVTERLYRGHCRDNELLSSTLAQFTEKEAELRALIEQLEGLSEHRKRPVRRYIEAFYDDFSTPKKLKRNFLDDCSND